MSQEKNYRDLSGGEIKILISNGCSSDEWSKIRVLNGFDPARCRNVTFSGNIRIGKLKGSFTDKAGVIIPGGIINARLHNCNIGSDVIIANIGEYIANYNISDGVCIQNCGKIVTEGISGFGNNALVAVLNESGGRMVRIHDRLSAHEAYIMTMYRHRTGSINLIGKMIDNYTASQSSSKGTISSNSMIVNLSLIHI